LLAHGWWFSTGTPASSTTKTGRHDVAEILLKVVLNTKYQIKSDQSDYHLLWTEEIFLCSTKVKAKFILHVS
jgi:hypothetical protein